MSGKKLESVHCVKDLGVTITSNLGAAGKANRMLGFIKKNSSFKNKDIILLLLSKGLTEHKMLQFVLGALDKQDG